MVLRSSRLAALAAATALILFACSAPESDAPSGDPTASAEASADASATTGGTGSDDATDGASDVDATDGAEPEVHATTGAVVDGIPDAIAPLPDAEIVSSSVEPAGDGQPVAANITMRTDSSEEDVLKFYADHLEKAGFEPVGDPRSEDGITTQTYHADEAGQLISISISTTDDGLLVSAGGKALP